MTVDKHGAAMHCQANAKHSPYVLRMNETFCRCRTYCGRRPFS